MLGKIKRWFELRRKSRANIEFGKQWLAMTPEERNTFYFKVRMLRRSVRSKYMPHYGERERVSRRAKLIRDGWITEEDST